MINLPPFPQANHEPCPPLLHEEFSSTGNEKGGRNPRRNRMEESGFEINRGLVTATNGETKVSGEREHTPRDS